jgi:quercetin dioxygenase-like cupin family protein
MQLPDFIENFPAIDLPVPDDIVKTHVLRADSGLMVIFEFLKDFDLPAHAHKAQWGTVLHGSVTLTIGGDTKTYLPGDSYNIPSGVNHSARIPAGAKVMDIFEEPDRYPLKS